MKQHYKEILNYYNFDSTIDYEIAPYMVMKKQLELPIISFGELKEKLLESG